MVNAYSRASVTWDEPIHLTAGYAALVVSIRLVRDLSAGEASKDAYRQL